MGDGYTIGDADGPSNEAAIGAVGVLMETMVPGAMVTKFVLIVEAIDGDSRSMFAFCAPKQMKWDTLGLLAYLTALESNVSLAGPDTGD